MAKAFSSELNEENISFESESAISTSSAWIRDKGSINTGSQIVMGADSKCHLVQEYNDETISYVKFKLRVDSDDTTLSTDSFHAVTGICEISLEDDELNSQIKTFSFYPKYIFEDTFQNDYTIVQLGSTYKLKSIKFTLINKEEVEIKVKKVGLYLSKVIDEEDLDNAISDAINRMIDDGQLILDYKVPEMTLSEWLAADKTKQNECIIIGA